MQATMILAVFRIKVGCTGVHGYENTRTIESDEM